jgi:hypothetical protein
MDDYEQLNEGIVFSLSLSRFLFPFLCRFSSHDTYIFPF